MSAPRANASGARLVPPALPHPPVPLTEAPAVVEPAEPAEPKVVLFKPEPFPEPLPLPEAFPEPLPLPEPFAPAAAPLAPAAAALPLASRQSLPPRVPFAPVPVLPLVAPAAPVAVPVGLPVEPVVGPLLVVEDAGSVLAVVPAHVGHWQLCPLGQVLISAPSVQAVRHTPLPPQALVQGTSIQFGHSAGISLLKPHDCSMPSALHWVAPRVQEPAHDGVTVMHWLFEHIMFEPHGVEVQS